MGFLQTIAMALFLSERYQNAKDGEAESFIDIRVKRYPEMDNKDNLTQKELWRHLWKEGWTFTPDDCPSFNGDNDNDFDRWYDNERKNKKTWIENSRNTKK